MSASMSASTYYVLGSYIHPGMQTLLHYLRYIYIVHSIAFAIQRDPGISIT